MIQPSRAVYTFNSHLVPRVKVFELITAWDNAMEAGFSFAPDRAQIYQFDLVTETTNNSHVFTSAESCRWLKGIDSAISLSSATGASCAMRFLALMIFLEKYQWAGHLIHSDENGHLNIHPNFVRSAANLSLTFGDTFSEDDMRRSLTQNRQGHSLATPDI